MNVELGKTYHRLTPIKLVSVNSKGIKFFKVSCTCGSEKIIPGYRLTCKSNPVKSCGCLRTEARSRLGKLSRHAPGEAAKRLLHVTYRRDAKRRGIVFDVPIELFLSIIAKPCHYCEAPPSNRAYPKRYYGGCLYTGIDRVNNNGGYTVDNIVPCCRRCNLAKRDSTLEEFSEWIIRVHAVTVLNNRLMPAR